MRFLLCVLLLQNAWAKFGDKKEKTTYAKNPLPEYNTSKYAKFSIQDRYDLYESMGNIKERNNFESLWSEEAIFIVILKVLDRK